MCLKLSKQPVIGQQPVKALREDPGQLRSEDLAAEELAQLKVITQFLPAQMSEEEITAALKQLIADNNISGIKEMGKLMGLASKQFAGKADNKLVSQIVKQLLS